VKKKKKLYKFIKKILKQILSLEMKKKTKRPFRTDSSKMCHDNSWFLKLRNIKDDFFIFLLKKLIFSGKMQKITVSHVIWSVRSPCKVCGSSNICFKLFFKPKLNKYKNEDDEKRTNRFMYIRKEHSISSIKKQGGF
jgi:hypothetical protein